MVAVWSGMLLLGSARLGLVWCGLYGGKINNSRFSVVIPIYEYNGYAEELLKWNFQKLKQQTFKNFEVCISDNSQDDIIKNLCKSWERDLCIRYYRNPIRGAAENTNSAIRMAQGEIVKILCGDDYLFDKNSLGILSDNFTNDVNWLASAYIHTQDRKNYYRYFIPSISQYPAIINLIGSPSCIAIRNRPDLQLMDEKLSYCYDSDWYYRLILDYGLPKIITTITMANYIWENSVTSSISPEIIQKENEYIYRKYNGNIRFEQTIYN